jgi:hypothetical protein
MNLDEDSLVALSHQTGKEVGDKLLKIFETVLLTEQRVFILLTVMSYVQFMIVDLQNKEGKSMGDSRMTLLNNTMHNISYALEQLEKEKSNER